MKSIADESRMDHGFNNLLHGLHVPDLRYAVGGLGDDEGFVWTETNDAVVGAVGRADPEGG